MVHLARGFRPELIRSATQEWLEDFTTRLERSRYRAVPVLLLGGEPEERARVARLIFEHGPTRDGSFLAADCRLIATDADLPWMWEHEGAPEHGALFLDSIEDLPEARQRRLLAWMEGQARLAMGAAPRHCRVMAGIHEVRTRSGHDDRPTDSLLPTLLDSLDVWRVNLSNSPHV